MKKKISFLILLGFSFYSVQLYSQSCTQCDNSGDPPGTYASEIGQGTTASGDYSFAGGINSEASEGVAFAFGNTAKALGAYSVAFGAVTTANGGNSYALGSFCSAIGTNSFVIGNGMNSSILFENTIGYSMMIGFNSDRPTFFIGKASGIGSTGKIGIGDVTDPQAKLHIKADENEPATLFIESHSFGGNNSASLWLGTQDFGLKALYGKLYFNTAGNYIFNSENANVGIGVLNPTEKLEVEGKIKTTGFQLIDGNQADGKILKSDDEGNGFWESSNTNCFECLILGANASAIGKYDTAYGEQSFVGGYNSKAFGNLDFVFGAHSSANGTSSVAIGHFVEASVPHTVVIGKGASINNKLTNDISGTLMFGSGSEKPTLFIGHSAPGYTGSVGIGDVTDPQAKLHIKADEGESATLFIEAHSFGGYNGADLWLGTTAYGLKAMYGKLYFKTAGDYIFNDEGANVGIGTLVPKAKLQVNGDIMIEDENAGLILKSPDGQCWKISVNNDGTLNTILVDCDLTTGGFENQQSNTEKVSIYPNPANHEVTVECINLNHGFVEIRDLKGALLLQQKLSTGLNQISLQNLNQGYYLVTVLDSGKKAISSEKILKQ
ncbi:MAG: T9SS type A sorting domain-containing protein [Bacteroidales bacterium]